MAETLEERIMGAVNKINQFTEEKKMYATKADIEGLTANWKKIEAYLNENPQTKTVTEDRKAIDMMFAHIRDYSHPEKYQIQAAAQESSVAYGPSAGYLAPPEYVREILRLVEDIGGIRTWARKFTTSSSMIEIPVEESGTTSGWVSEREEGPDSPPVKYRMRRIPIHGLYANIAYTREILADAVFDIEMETNRQISIAFAKAENRGMLFGTSKNMPEGLLVSNLVPASNNFDINIDPIVNMDAPDQLIMATAALPAVNRANYAWYMNNRTLTKLRTLKVPTSDGTGAYAFNIDLASGPVPRLNGFDVRLVPELPDFDEKKKEKLVKDKAYSILFGSMSDAYGVVDRQSIDYIYDEISRKQQRIVEYTFWNRLGAGVLNGSQILKINTV